MKKYISASQIKLYMTCPVQYYHTYIDIKSVPFQENIYMVYGTAVHFALETYFKTYLKTKTRLTLDEVLKAFNKKFEEEMDRINVDMFSNDTLIKSMYLASETTLNYYINKVAKNITPKASEQVFEIKLKHYPIIIKGYIDLITDEGYIIDFKTVGKTWKKQYNDKSLSENIQGALYAVAYRKMFKEKELGVRFDVMPRNDNRVYLMEATITDEYINYILEYATNMDKLNKQGVFVPNTSKCSQCPFKNICKKQIIVK